MDVKNYTMNVELEFCARSQKEAEDMALALKEVLDRNVDVHVSANTFVSGKEVFDIPWEHNDCMCGTADIDAVESAYDDIYQKEAETVAKEELKLVEAEIRAKGYPTEIEVRTEDGLYKCEYVEDYNPYQGAWQYYYEIRASYDTARNLARPYGKDDDYVNCEIGDTMTEQNEVGTERHNKGIAA